MLSMQDERRYQRSSTTAQRSEYLGTDVLMKVRDDDGYRKKVEMMELALTRAGCRDGLILDIGAGTCGEDEYLATRGFQIVCTDVNDVALDVSQKRSAAFRRPLLRYVACDGQVLPFVSNSFAAVIFNESLHHMPDVRATIKEASRALKPGGALCMLEPYAYDPWRRISEIRDYMRGSIEKSFSIGQLKRMLEEAGLTTTSIERPLYLSKAKLSKLHPIHRVARTVYYALREIFPRWLGMILLVAHKRAEEPVDSQ